MSPLYGRWQRRAIERALKTRRVVLLVGARQCGKTTLAGQMVSENVAYRTLDDLSARQVAETDPGGFVKHAGTTLIIDEVQRVPELLPAIKMQVDKDTRAGQYLLTGSADIGSSPGVRESLAGRIRKIRLRPLTQGEITGGSPDFLNRAFMREFEHPSRSYDRDAVLNMCLRGGFPEAMSLGETDRREWHRDYVDAILERDLRELVRIRRRGAMTELIRALAAWSGKFMDISTIASGLSISRPTVESYINALESLYVVERVRPWKRTDYERVGSRPGPHVLDSRLEQEPGPHGRGPLRQGHRNLHVQRNSRPVGRLRGKVRAVPLPGPGEARDRLSGRTGGRGAAGHRDQGGFGHRKERFQEPAVVRGQHSGQPAFYGCRALFGNCRGFHGKGALGRSFRSTLAPEVNRPFRPARVIARVSGGSKHAASEYIVRKRIRKRKENPQDSHHRAARRPLTNRDISREKRCR